MRAEFLAKSSCIPCRVWLVRAVPARGTEGGLGLSLCTPQGEGMDTLGSGNQQYCYFWCIHS